MWVGARFETRHVAAFAGGGRGREPRRVGGLCKVEKARKQIPSQSLEKSSAPPHLDFSPVRETHVRRITSALSLRTRMAP